MSSAEGRAAGPRRVVITGVGVVSPLGLTAAALGEALATGRSGVCPLTCLPPIEGQFAFGGECRDFTGEIDDFGPLEKDLKKSIRKALKMMCRESMMAVAAAQQALGDAGLAQEPGDPDRFGVVFGSDYMLSPPDDLRDALRQCGVGQGEFDYDRWGTVGLKGMNPLWMLNYLPNMPASHVAIFNDLRGPNNSLTMREASSLLAIREAVHTIERGHADRMLAGATGTRLHSFKSIHALQLEPLADAGLPPQEASRPFDAQRTGMVLGEGAGVIVLEEAASAAARGARVYGEVVGLGSSAATDRSGRPDPATALATAAQGALAASAAYGAGATALGHVNAHAAGTTTGDAAEATAIRTAIGGADVPVFAPKSYFGNLGAGGGAVELAASLLSFSAPRLYETLNYRQPDPACPVRVAAAGAGLPAGDSFLKLSVTPQGQAAAIVVRRAC